MGKLIVRPLTLAQANELIEKLHRHHKKVLNHRFTIGAEYDGQFVGAATVGRPVARAVPQYTVAEVTRLVSDGTPHVCSMLYAACARAAQAMGYWWIQTYILDSEPGTSVKAAGWTPILADGSPCEVHECMTAGGNWNSGPRKGRRVDQPMVPKQRWGKALNSKPEVCEQ